jgi:Spy/CpxP family protein refolding chaperone
LRTLGVNTSKYQIILLVTIKKKYNMKKYGMLALAFGFIFSLAVSAQDQMPPQGQGEGPRPEMRQGNRPQMTPQVRAERLAKQLDLTDAQKAQVQALYEKQNAERQKKQAEVQKTREEMKAQFDAERKAQDIELEKIIGPEKMKKLQDMRAERMKQREENGPRPQPNDVK